MTENLPATPRHLSPASRVWFREVTGKFVLESHHVKLLVLACESFDRCVQARTVLDKEGLTYQDASDCPRSRPEIAVERDSRLAFARLLRELDLDLEAPRETSVRPPKLVGERG